MAVLAAPLDAGQVLKAVAPVRPHSAWVLLTAPRPLTTVVRSVLVSAVERLLFSEALFVRPLSSTLSRALSLSPTVRPAGALTLVVTVRTLPTARLPPAEAFENAPARVAAEAYVVPFRVTVKASVNDPAARAVPLELVSVSVLVALNVPMGIAVLPVLVTTLLNVAVPGVVTVLLWLLVNEKSYTCFWMIRPRLLVSVLVASPTEVPDGVMSYCVPPAVLAGTVYTAKNSLLASAASETAPLTSVSVPASYTPLPLVSR